MTRKPGSHDLEGNPSGHDVDDGSLPPLDAELRALFAAERRHPGPSAGSSERVRLAVLATAAAAAAGSGAAAATGAAAGAAAASGGIATGGASSSVASSVASVASVASSVGATSGVGTTVGTAAASTVASGALGATVGTSAAATSGAVGSSIGIGLGGGVLKGGLAIAAAVAATAGGGVLIANYEVSEPSPFEDVAVEVVDDTVARPKPPAGLVVDAPPSDDGNNNNTIGTGKGKAVTPRLAVKQAPPANTLARPEADTAVDTAVDDGPTPPMSAEDLATERGLIANARQALRDDDGGGALLAVTAHADRFPRGLLREERDAIQIMALLKMGRRDQADSLSTRFAARYPRSLFAEAIRQAHERADR